MAFVQANDTFEEKRRERQRALMSTGLENIAKGYASYEKAKIEEAKLAAEAEREKRKAVREDMNFVVTMNDKMGTNIDPFEGAEYLDPEQAQKRRRAALSTEYEGKQTEYDQETKTTTGFEPENLERRSPIGEVQDFFTEQVPVETRVSNRYFRDSDNLRGDYKQKIQAVPKEPDYQGLKGLFADATAKPGRKQHEAAYKAYQDFVFKTGRELRGDDYHRFVKAWVDQDNETLSELMGGAALSQKAQDEQNKNAAALKILGLQGKKLEQQTDPNFQDVQAKKKMAQDLDKLRQELEIKKEFGALPGQKTQEAPLKDFEYTAYYHWQNANEAEKDYRKLVAEGFKPQSYKTYVKLLIAPSASWDDQTKRFVNSVNRFVNAQKRKESGASVATHETLDYIKNNFPEAGDGPSVMSQKDNARRTLLDALSEQGFGVRKRKLMKRFKFTEEEFSKLESMAEQSRVDLETAAEEVERRRRLKNGKR